MHCSAAETGFSNILHIFMVSAAQDHPQQWPKICLKYRRTESRNAKRCIFHIQFMLSVNSKKQSFGLFLQIEIQTKKRLNQDGGRGRLDLPGWIRQLAWDCFYLCRGRQLHTPTLVQSPHSEIVLTKTQIWTKNLIVERIAMCILYPSISNLHSGLVERTYAANSSH